jgi:hypothetical protein
MGGAAIAERIRLQTVALLRSRASQKFDHRQSLNFAALRLRARLPHRHAIGAMEEGNVCKARQVLHHDNGAGHAQ